jgi:catechol 2,3-dioxygenase-like lactoylglutathione lyase family enzyme
MRDLMKPTVFFLCLLIATGAYAQAAGVTRPKITGIDHVAFYTTSAEANGRLYTTVLGLQTAPPLEPGQTQRFMVGTQWVGYSPAPDPKATDRMDHVALNADDCAGLRSYLAANGVAVEKSITRLKNGASSFSVKDPEGHNIEFVERPKSWTEPVLKGDSVSRRLIHAGFIVRNRDAEDHFYKDILGFHIYWHGGMQPNRTDWVAMQVPDGTDWLEYMLNVDAKPSLQLTGVMNHISLGVSDMKQAQAKLESHGWKPHGDEHAQMGKDGKWQLNLYDLDFTRIELMEFTPAQKPCCSDFTGPHPHEP